MHIEQKSPVLRCLLAATLALGGAAAHAAGGYTVTHAQEANVTTGLTAAEVRQMLGRPARVERFMGEAGPVWTYNVSGGIDPMAVFEVDFGPDGKVASVVETAVQVD
jgi:outer membrane protein assembly factor BamE (lipoprotein component of BamABCDE complex)